MSARSVAELLPRPFADLTLDDVAAIITSHGEDRETLYFERKAQVTNRSLAKSCAAFANTAGGLLVVGVADDDDTLVGTTGIGPEAQVWVKDVLRSHVLPLPPFLARRFEVDADHAVLLVLVEYSSTTPHLLTSNGAIYVRNPGSSDPVPINNQAAVFDLLDRGERSRDDAEQRAQRGATEGPPQIEYFPSSAVPITLALVPTGTGAWFETELLERRGSIERVAAALAEWPANTQTTSDMAAEWEQDALMVWRRVAAQRYLERNLRVESIRVHRDGTTLLHQADTAAPEYPHDLSLEPDQIRAWLQVRFRVGRELLLDLGAHGDLRLVFRLGTGRALQWEAGRRYFEVKTPIIVMQWTALDLDSQAEAQLLDRIVAEIGRAVGVGPDA